VLEREEVRKRAYKRRYDQLVFPRTFEVGDLVLMKDHVPTGKLEARWIGTHDGGESEPHGYLSLVRALWWKIERSHKRGQPEAMGGAIWDDSRSAVGKRG
jgi:hypothetical protein